MSTATLFSQDAYRQRCEATVTAVTGNGIVLDQTVFYPLGGGQPGDSGHLLGPGGDGIFVNDTRKGEAGAIVHCIDEPSSLNVGDRVEAVIDWPRRYRHMRMHTCMHLLGSLIPFGVTGGNISDTKSRLDFDMPESVDKVTLTAQLNALIEADHMVSTRWITQQELDAQPELVRTLSVKPPAGAQRVRLLDIQGVDLQPCGGTHVRHTAEIGRVRVSKVENKGRHNRRVNVVFDE